MSFWGAKVIISLFGAIPVIGNGLTEWIMGDYLPSDATLNRFFALHVIAVPLVLLLVLWARTWRVSAARAALLVAVAYLGVLFAVYLSTPHDLAWHLATSAKRVALPVQLLLMYGVLVLLDQWKQTAPRQRAGERNA